MRTGISQLFKTPNMHIVYRLEHKNDGIGPYHRVYDSLFNRKTRIGIREVYNGKLVHQGPEHPTPTEDEGIGRYAQEEERVGFISKQQMLNWFTPFEIRSLIRLGYRIRVYKNVKEVVVGKRQCLFIP